MTTAWGKKTTGTGSSHTTIMPFIILSIRKY